MDSAIHLSFNRVEVGGGGGGVGTKMFKKRFIDFSLFKDYKKQCFVLDLKLDLLCWEFFSMSWEHD